MKTTKQFVHKILLPYLHIQISQLRSQENQRMAWLLDYWFVHKSHEFLDWWSKHTQPSWDTIDKIGIDLWKRPNRIKNPNLLEPQYKPPNWGSIPQFTLRNLVMGFWNKTWDKHGLVPRHALACSLGATFGCPKVTLVSAHKTLWSNFVWFIGRLLLWWDCKTCWGGHECESFEPLGSSKHKKS